MSQQIFCFCALLVLVHPAKLPKTWKTCKKNDPKINECLKVAIEGALIELAKEGNPTLGVFPLEPLTFKSLTLDQGQGPVSVKLSFHDLDITGLKDITIQNVKTNWQEMEIQMLTPKLTLAGKYKVDGKVLLLPITGDGDCELIFNNYNTTATLKIKEITKNGKKYYDVTDFITAFEADSSHVQFNNLFNGDKALEDNMNLFLNENAREILNELRPAISKAFGVGFKDIANRIFSKVPINEISP